MSTAGSRRDDWMRDALCVCFPDFPWTLDGHRVSGDDEDLMGQVCRLCPVLAQCRRYVQTEHIIAGYWAGQHRTPETDPAQQQQQPKQPTVNPQPRRAA